MIGKYLVPAVAAAMACCCVLAAPAASAAPTIADYGNLPAFEEAAISPDGSRVALVATLNDARTLVVLEGNTPLRKINLGDVKVRDVEWATNDLVMIDFSQTERLWGFTTEKAEFYRTIVLSAVTGTNELLFDKRKDIAKATFGWYGIRDIGGLTYGFFGGVPLEAAGQGEYEFVGGAPALFKVELASMHVSQVANRAREGEWRRWLVDEAGTVAATLIGKDSDGSWRILNSADKEIAAGKNPMGGIWLMSFGYDGSTLIYGREDEASGESRYFEVPLAGGNAVERFADIDIARFYTHPRSGRLLGHVVDNTAEEHQFADPAIGKRFAKIGRAFAKVNRSVADMTTDLSKVVLVTSGNGDSGTWWTVDLAKLQASPIGYERPAINPADVGPISTVAYKAADGLDLDGILTLPPGRDAKNLPVVMLPHGGPTSHDEETFDWWAQAFASRGYAVFQPNFRGSTNRDPAFVRAGHGEWGRKMQTDISDGLAHLAAQGVVDPKRACIVGASYGGYAAMAGITMQDDVYRCAVAVAGVSDLSLMVSTDIAESGDDPVLKRNLAAEIGSGRDLKDVSPRRLAARANAPLLLIHGKDDTVVPYRQSKIMADAMADAGKPVTLITLDGEDHWLSKSATRLRMLTETISFVEKHNPPGPTSTVAP